MFENTAIFIDSIVKEFIGGHVENGNQFRWIIDKLSVKHWIKLPQMFAVQIKPKWICSIC